MTGYIVGDNNQMTSDGTYNYTYDAEGNRLTRTSIATGDVMRYVWDHRNRLVAVIQEDDEENVLSETTHTYDYQNRWISHTVDADGDGPGGSETTVFVHESQQIVLEFEGSAASDLSHRYLWGPSIDQLLAAEEVDSLISAGEVLFPLSDHLGTTRDLAEYDSGLDTTTIASHRTFDSFGNIAIETNSAVDLLFGYTSRPHDDSTSLQNNLNCWLDSQTGNWISEDPIGLRGNSPNLNEYLANSTIGSTDPTGLIDHNLVSRLVMQLGADEYHSRETAQIQLIEQVQSISDIDLLAGILEQHPFKFDPEIQQRGRFILSTAIGLHRPDNSISMTAKVDLLLPRQSLAIPNRDGRFLLGHLRLDLP